MLIPEWGATSTVMIRVVQGARTVCQPLCLGKHVLARCGRLGDVFTVCRDVVVEGVRDEAVPPDVIDVRLALDLGVETAIPHKEP